jgi:uncharacterized protein YeaO (DUF488 family)
VSLHVVRLGSSRGSEEGLRIGTVRRPPRGVPQGEYGERDYYDLWLPELAPSATLLSWLKTKPLTDARWRTFARRYRGEMRRPTPQRLIALLAALSLQQNLSVGCYCADESRCHRAILRELLRQAGAALEVT